MRVAEGWQDYELVDATNGERLERWGKITLIRPDPQVIWKEPRRSALWEKADAAYSRSSSGGGEWTYQKSIPRRWTISWAGKINLSVMPTDFKHTGVFPEQAANWEWYIQAIEKAKRPIKVLNLFGYTGAATVACLLAGAAVCHVDASKGMVAMAKENVSLNGLEKGSVRYIVEDCKKFLLREIRRASRYDALILDPPSYGRGPSGERWKLEEDLYSFMMLCRKVLVAKPLFAALNSYTAGMAPGTMRYLMEAALDGFEGKVQSDELGLRISSSDRTLPAGATALYLSEEVSG